MNQLELRRRSMLNGPRIPAAYREVAYIEGPVDGAGFDTGVSGGNNALRLAGKAQFGGQTTWAPLFGNYVNDQSNVTRFIQNNTGDKVFVYINSIAGGGIISYYAAYLINTPFIFDVSQTRFIWNGAALGLREYDAGEQNNDNIAFNARKVNSLGGSGLSWNNRWYWFRIYDGSMLIRYYLPCVRSSDQAAGMYDIVNKTFNPSISIVPFTAGPHVV